MANIPWHEEVSLPHPSPSLRINRLLWLQVLNFVQTYADLLPDYEVCCEHEHSNCVLIAHKKVGLGLDRARARARG